MNIPDQLEPTIGRQNIARIEYQIAATEEMRAPFVAKRDEMAARLKSLNAKKDELLAERAKAADALAVIEREMNSDASAGRDLLAYPKRIEKARTAIAAIDDVVAVMQAQIDPAEAERKAADKEAQNLYWRINSAQDGFKRKLQVAQFAERMHLWIARESQTTPLPVMEAFFKEGKTAGTLLADASKSLTIADPVRSSTVLETFGRELFGAQDDAASKPEDESHPAVGLGIPEEE